VAEAWNSMGFKFATQENNMGNKNSLQNEIENGYRKVFEEHATLERDS